MKSFRRRIHRLQQSDRSGAALVEFAFVAPAVLLFIWGSLEFIWFSSLDNLANMAAYRAARTVIVPGATIAEGQAEAQRVLGGFAGRSATINVNPIDINGNIQTEIDDFTARVEVTVLVPVADNLPMLSQFIGSDRIINSTTSLTFESYSGFYDGFSF